MTIATIEICTRKGIMEVSTYRKDKSADKKRDEGRNTSANEPSSHVALEGCGRWETEDQCGRVKNGNVENSHSGTRHDCY